MNARILNRDFEHPSDGWYQIEALGDHPNRAAGVLQVIDQAAAQSIVNRFNADAAAGKLRQGNEMLIDHEHFSDQPDQETRAYGWLQELQNREDGIYGRIRWTATGKLAVDGGDYRFFSTEYSPADLKVLNRKADLKRVRPMRLDGLSLTNMLNNRGQKPITNRSISIKVRPLPADGKCPDCDVQLQNDEDDGSGVKVCPSCKSHFAGSTETAEETKTKNRKVTTMKKLATALGLAEEASEDSILAALTKLKNRVTELEPLSEENTKLKNRVKQIDVDAIAALLDARGVKDEKVKNRLTSLLVPMPTLEERTACLDEFGFKAETKAGTARVLNRGSASSSAADPTAAEADDAEVAKKIMNRAHELKGASTSRTFDSCWNQARAEIVKPTK